MYSPTLGRFLQTDPLGYVDGLNLYAYVENNPASWVDPWGLTVREGFADIFDPEETINVHRGARDVVGMAAGLGIIGLLDALLSEILSDDDEEDLSPASTEDENTVCEDSPNPGNKKGPDVTREVYDKLEELSEASKRVTTKIKYGPALESGLTRELQRAIIGSLEEGDVIAVRTRPYKANYLDGKYPAKGPGAVVAVKYKNGVRVLSDGNKVVSDLDIAFVTRKGRAVGNTTSLKKYGGKINKEYGYDVVTHGDNYSGVLAENPGALRVLEQNEIIYIFSNKGFIESGRYNAMIRKYIKQ